MEEATDVQTGLQSLAGTDEFQSLLHLHSIRGMAPALSFLDDRLSRLFATYRYLNEYVTLFC